MRDVLFFTVLPVTVLGFLVFMALVMAHYTPEPLADESADPPRSNLRMLPGGPYDWSRENVVIGSIEPGSFEDLFNRADPHCEGCGGRGLIQLPPTPGLACVASQQVCECTTWVES